MELSWKKYMRLGIVQFMAYPETMKGEGPILETLERTLADDFFDVVEITTIKDPAVRAKAKNLLAASAVTVAYGSQPVQLVNKLNLNSFDAAEHVQAIDRCKACVDEAFEMGAAGVAFLSGPDPGADKRKQASELLIDSLCQLCAHAETKGNIKVVLETFDRDVDKKSLIGPSVEGVAVSARVRQKHQNFGLMVDLSHLPLQKEASTQALNTVKDHLVHAHMGNCVVRDRNHPAYGDQHPRFGIAGGENGASEVAEYIRTLLAIGYLNDKNPGILSFEVKPLPGESSAVVIGNAKRTLHRAWQMV